MLLPVVHKDDGHIHTQEKVGIIQKNMYNIHFFCQALNLFSPHRVDDLGIVFDAIHKKYPQAPMLGMGMNSFALSLRSTENTKSSIKLTNEFQVSQLEHQYL